jgi:hypothetical protein
MLPPGVGGLVGQARVISTLGLTDNGQVEVDLDETVWSVHLLTPVAVTVEVMEQLALAGTG